MSEDLVPDHMYDAQLKLWVKGRPYHNVIHDLCVPDFSCCHPEMLQDEEIRKCFYYAYKQKKVVVWDQLLYMFAECMLAKENGHRIIINKN